MSIYDKNMSCLKNKIFKKFGVLLVLGVFVLMQIAPCCKVIAEEQLPDLPELPEFDTVLPPSGIDAFAPSSTPSQVAAPLKNSTVTQATTQKAVQQEVQKHTQPANAPKEIITRQPVVVPKTPAVKNNTISKSNISTNSYVIPKGKKFKVRLQQTVSDRTAEGSRISFVSVYPETATYITIPSGTVFRGRVSNTHPPYITGNGGLIVINVDQMVYKGKTYEIDAKVSVANDKRIFLNNIKGKRMYLRSIPKTMKPGTKFFKKMWKVTCNLARNDSGVEIILTPFSFVTGTVVYVVNLALSPVLAIFYKGKSITIPKNSPFTIQLREDAVVFK